MISLEAFGILSRTGPKWYTAPFMISSGFNVDVKLLWRCLIINVRMLQSFPLNLPNQKVNKVICCPGIKFEACMHSTARRQITHLGIHQRSPGEGRADEAGKLISWRILTSNALISFESAFEQAAGSGADFEGYKMLPVQMRWRKKKKKYDSSGRHS